MRNVYKDEIVNVLKISVSEEENIFDKIKEIRKDHKNNVLYLDYLPSKLINNFNVNNNEDVRKFHDLLYKCDTPLLNVASYNLDDNIISLYDPLKNIKGLFNFYQNKVIYYRFDKKMKYERYRKNVSCEHYISDISFDELLNMMLDKAQEIFICDMDDGLNRNDLSFTKVSKDEFLDIVNLRKEEKILKKIK